MVKEITKEFLEFIASFPQKRKEEEEDKEKTEGERLKENEQRKERFIQEKIKLINRKEEDDKKSFIFKNDEGIHYNFRGAHFLFCGEGYKRFEEEFKADHFITINEGGYLAREPITIDFEMKKYYLPIEVLLEIKKETFHGWLKEEEAKELTNKLKCPKNEIHIHHNNGKKTDNRVINLKVLHKDDHAKEHGFNTWEEMQESRKEKGKPFDMS